MDDKSYSLAVFIDYENLALGTGKRDARGHQRPGPLPKMDMIMERLVEKGRINVKRAYCDWQRFQNAVTPLHELGVELIEIPDRAYTGKNSADIRLVADAMEMCFTKDHINAFVICSGDSDFSPLVAKLKEHGKIVIGVGMREATSSLLVNNCDDFIFYEDIGISIDAPEYRGIVEPEKEEAYRLLFNAIEALNRENVDVMLASLIKDTIKRKRPDFSESNYGYRNFTALLQEAERYGFIMLSRDHRSGTWCVDGFSSNPPQVSIVRQEQKSTSLSAPTQKPATSNRRPRRTARNNNGNNNGGGSNNGNNKNDAAKNDAAAQEAEEKAKREAEAKAKREAEAKAKAEAEAKAKREAEEKAKREAEEKAKREEEAKQEAAEAEKAAAAAAQETVAKVAAANKAASASKSTTRKSTTRKTTTRRTTTRKTAAKKGEEADAKAETKVDTKADSKADAKVDAKAPATAEKDADKKTDAAAEKKPAAKRTTRRTSTTRKTTTRKTAAAKAKDADAKSDTKADAKAADKKADAKADTKADNKEDAK